MHQIARIWDTPLSGGFADRSNEDQDIPTLAASMGIYVKVATTAVAGSLTAMVGSLMGNMRIP